MKNLRRPAAWRYLATAAAAALALTLSPTGAQASIAPPTGLAPNDVSGAMLKNLELGWSGVVGATSYDVQVTEDESFEGTLLSTSTPTTHWALPVSLPRNSYVWRVRAQTADGAGSWSETGNFTRGWDRSTAPGNPHLVTSAGSTTDSSFVMLPGGELPAFTWNPMLGASFYELEVSSVPFTSSDPAYSGTADDFRFTCYTQRTWFAPYGVVAGVSDAPGDEAKCSLTMSGDEPPADNKIGDQYHNGVTYYWRVRGRDGSATPGTTPFTAPALSCTGVWPTTGGTGTELGVTFKIPSTPPKFRDAPECSQWSNGGSFGVTAVASPAVATPPGSLLAQPTAGDPAAARVALTGTPVLRWRPVLGSAYYRVHLSRTSDFTDSDIVYETHATSLSPASSFADRSGPTYWTVQACGALRCSPAAPSRIFTKASTNKVRTGAVTTAGNETTLNWFTQWIPAGPSPASPVPSDDQASSYQLQVDTLTGDWSAPPVDIKVDNLGSDPVSTYSRIATTSLPDRYVWRVRALDESGRGWAWAYSAPFGRVTSADGLGLGSPVTVTFTSPVKGVESGASILDSAGHRVSGTFDQQNTTTWTFAATKGWLAGESYHLSLSGVTDKTGRGVRVIPDRVKVSQFVDSGSAQLVKTKGDYAWATKSASDASNRSFVRTSDKPKTARVSRATTKVMGRYVDVYACKSPRSGRAAIVVDHKLVGVVDLYRTYSSCGLVWKSPKALASKAHTVTVQTMKSKRAKAKGYDLNLDGIGVR